MESIVNVAMLHFLAVLFCPSHCQYSTNVSLIIFEAMCPMDLYRKSLKGLWESSTNSRVYTFDFVLMDTCIGSKHWSYPEMSKKIAVVVKKLGRSCFRIHWNFGQAQTTGLLHLTYCQEIKILWIKPKWYVSKLDLFSLPPSKNKKLGPLVWEGLSCKVTYIS